MSETQQPEKVTDDDLNLAIHVLADWHKQHDFSFAIVNSSDICLLAKGGKPMTIEASLNHAHKMMEMENHHKIASFYAAQTAANQIKTSPHSN